MDDWTYPYSDPEAEAPSAQPNLLGEIWSGVEESLHAVHAEGAAQAEAARRAADLEQARVWDSVDDGRNVLDVPLPFEAPVHTALTY
jgi:hypothetical protein